MKVPPKTIWTNKHTTAFYLSLSFGLAKMENNNGNWQKWKKQNSIYSVAAAAKNCTGNSGFAFIFHHEDDQLYSRVFFLHFIHYRCKHWVSGNSNNNHHCCFRFSFFLYFLLLFPLLLCFQFHFFLYCARWSNSFTTFGMCNRSWIGMSLCMCMCSDYVGCNVECNYVFPATNSYCIW